MSGAYDCLGGTGSEGASAPGAPAISVIIPTFRRPQQVRLAVLSACQQDLAKDRYEVIVVDSSPSDENVAVVRELQGQVPCALRWYRKRAEGPGPSRNFGVHHARGEFIAFMDSDCQAHPSWLQKGLEAFAAGVGLVQGKTLPDPGGRPGVFTYYIAVDRESFVYECANMFYRRAAFLEAGGFSREYDTDALFVMGGEDVDLAWRVKRNGWRSTFAPEAVVYHEVQPISLLRWIVIKRLYIWPCLAKKFPELRTFFAARYFFDRSQAWFAVALLGLALIRFTSLAWLLCLPYAVHRASEPSRTFGGILRPLRALVYLPRDLASFLILTAGSIRYRCPLL